MEERHLRRAIGRVKPGKEGRQRLGAIGRLVKPPEFEMGFAEFRPACHRCFQHGDGLVQLLDMGERQRQFGLHGAVIGRNGGGIAGHLKARGAAIRPAQHIGKVEIHARLGRIMGDGIFEGGNGAVDVADLGVDIAKVVPTGRIARFGLQHAGIGGDRLPVCAALLHYPCLDPGKGGKR